MSSLPAPDMAVAPVPNRLSVLILCPNVHLRLEVRSQLLARRARVTHQRSLHELERTLRRYTPDVVVVEGGALPPAALRRFRRRQAPTPVLVVSTSLRGEVPGDVRHVVDGLDAVLAVLTGELPDA